MLLSVLSLLCVLLIGFATHRASLCNVRAVAVLLRCRSAFLLWSMTRAMLWVATLTGARVWLFDTPTAAVLTQQSLLWAIAGGLLFGVGAAVNGGCSLSTLHRLELDMLLTLSGFAAGVGLWAVFSAAAPTAALVPAPPLRRDGMACSSRPCCWGCGFRRCSVAPSPCACPAMRDRPCAMRWPAC